VSLAKEFGVSRTPVHEAIRQLTLEGLIEQTVTNKSRVVAFDSNCVQEIYEMRKILEVAAIKRASGNMNPKQLEKLVESTELLKCALEDQDWANRALDLDIKFHELIAEASGNERLNTEIKRYRLLLRAFCQITGNRLNLMDALEEHLMILNALRSGNKIAAANAMATHIDARRDAVLSEFYSKTATT
jgi:DNA-binding GntR family transcriptional regulator